MADNVHNKSQNIADTIKGGVQGIHGAGEMLRGGAMETVDNLFGSRGGEAKNRAVTEQGAAEMDKGEYHLTGQPPANSTGYANTGGATTGGQNTGLNQGAGYSNAGTTAGNNAGLNQGAGYAGNTAGNTGAGAGLNQGASMRNPGY